MKQPLQLATFMALLAFLAGCDSSSQSDTSASDTEAAAETVSITVRVNLPDDAPQVYISGNLPQLGPWHPAALAIPGEGPERSITIEVPKGHLLSYKITAGSWEQEGLGPSGTVMPDFKVMADADKETEASIAGFRKDPAELIATWQESGVIGELVYWKDMASEFLEENRHVVVWLPPGYADNPDETYKVIYTHDGQNLFDPRLSYTNMDWGIDEAMMRGVEAGSYEPAIIVGIWNTPARLYEYSPWHKADQYARFILEELKPKVDDSFRVKAGAENTFSMGSSMGGLISFYLVQNHSDVFSACGCLSTHVTWSEQQIEWFNGRDPSAADPMPFLLRSIESGAEMPSDVRMYFDYGTVGLDEHYDGPHQALKAWLEGLGFNEASLKVQKFEGADHSETAWRARVDQQLDWLLAE